MSVSKLRQRSIFGGLVVVLGALLFLVSSAFIIDRAFAAVAKMIADAQKELGADLSAHTLFAYGGNGGLFACASG